MIYLWALIGLNAFAAAAKCRSLSIEGGGSHGAYESGCITQFVESLPPSDIAWDVVTGISVGALNAAGLAMYPMGEEKEAAELIDFVWRNLNGSQSIFVEWPEGPAMSLFTRPSIYNNAPELQTMHKFYLRSASRHITIGGTNLNTGMFVNFNESLNHDDLLTAVLLSGSPPFFFPPVKFQGSWWADGGCILNLDVFSAVRRCLDIVPNQEDVIVDMLYDDVYKSLDKKTEFNSLEVLMRVHAIRSYDSYTWYTNNARVAYPNVDFRYIVHPSQALPGGYLPLDFKLQDLEMEIALGKADTKKVIENGPNGRAVIEERYNRVKAHVFYATD